MARVVVVGLGPAGADLLRAPRPGPRSSGVPARFVRTERHPAVDDLAAEGIAFTSFDARVRRRPTRSTTSTRGIVDELLAAAAEHGEVRVRGAGQPGRSPSAACALLHERGRARVTWRSTVVAGCVVRRARVGARRASTRSTARAWSTAAPSTRPTLEAGGPVLIAQVDGPLVASDVKLALLDHTGPDTPVTVLQRLGLARRARARPSPLGELDRDASCPTTSPRCSSTLARGRGRRVRRARGAGPPAARPGRLPVGRRADPPLAHPLPARGVLRGRRRDRGAARPTRPRRPVDPRAYADLADELGDLLFQVVFHGVLGEESGDVHAPPRSRAASTTSSCAATRTCSATSRPRPSATCVRNWEQIKKGEKGTDSLVESISPGLPALLYTHKLFRKAASVGLDPGDRVDAVLMLGGRGAAVGGRARRRRPSGARPSWATCSPRRCSLARDGGVDAESALRGWAGRYRARFLRMEDARPSVAVSTSTPLPTRSRRCGTRRPRRLVGGGAA